MSSQITSWGCGLEKGVVTLILISNSNLMKEDITYTGLKFWLLLGGLPIIILLALDFASDCFRSICGLADSDFYQLTYCFLETRSASDNIQN